VAERQVVLDAVRLDQPVLRHPVELTAERHRVAHEVLQHVAPFGHDPLGLVVGVVRCVHEPLDAFQVGLLDLQRAHLPAVGQADSPCAGEVVADLTDRADRVVQRQVANDRLLFEHAQHQVAGRDLQPVGVLGHVRVADDDVEPAVALGIGMGLVAGVDDRP
jgi:hypothetical protein